MYKIVEYYDGMDLSFFYEQAKLKGFTNNSSKEMLIDCFDDELDYKLWVLYYNDLIVGTNVAHSMILDDVKCYRICARTCVLSHLLPIQNIRTINQIKTHQNITAQFFIPTCIEYVGNYDMYITSHESDVGTQKLVHRIFAPTLEKTKVLTKSFDRLYRGHVQTFWKVNVDIFNQELQNYKRWNLSI